eukprot:jgi/Mesvir1/5367/Mv15449-RA.1
MKQTPIRLIEIGRYERFISARAEIALFLSCFGKPATEGGLPILSVDNMFQWTSRSAPPPRPYAEEPLARLPKEDLDDDPAPEPALYHDGKTSPSLGPAKPQNPSPSKALAVPHGAAAHPAGHDDGHRAVDSVSYSLAALLNSKAPPPAPKAERATPVTELQCPLCRTQFRDPVTLQCGHFVCSRPCAVDLLAANKVEIVCPVCAKNTKVPGGRIERALRPAYIVRKAICEGAGSGGGDAKAAAVKCELCEEGQENAATLFCNPCGKGLCEECSAQLHAFGKMRTHQIIPFANSAAAGDGSAHVSPGYLKAETCSVHNEVLKLFCEVDRLPVCVTCVYGDGDHRGHEATLLVPAFERERGDLLGQVTILKAHRERVVQIVKDITQIEAEIAKAGSQVTTHVNTEIGRVRKALDRREASILAAVDRLQADKVAKVEHEKDSWQVKLAEMSNVCTLAERALKEQDAVTFLATIGPFMKRLQAIMLKGAEDTDMHSFSNIVPFNITPDFSDAVEAIQKDEVIAELRSKVPGTVRNVRLEGPTLAWDPPLRNSIGCRFESNFTWQLGFNPLYEGSDRFAHLTAVNSTKLENSGMVMFVRVRAVNEHGEGPWTEVEIPLKELSAHGVDLKKLGLM